MGWDTDGKSCAFDVFGVDFWENFVDMGDEDGAVRGHIWDDGETIHPQAWRPDNPCP